MPHPYSEIPEFDAHAESRRIVRIPNEQDVPFTPRVQAIVDTAEFQRLRHISQLGLAAHVYPGANHTRFEHALGVFNNALHYLWQLGRDERFVAIVNPHRAEVLLVAALLHDLGHWPFCHPIEDLSLPNLPPHEAHAAEFLRSDGELALVLQRDWSIDPDEVLDVLVTKTASPELRLIRSILSGPIDIDKMDYLERDSLHCGVPYGRHFDRHRLIQSLVLNEDGDGLAISQKGRTAAELMVFARYVMFSEVYWHHAVRSATSMFARAFFELHQRFDLQSLFRLTDSEMVRRLRDEARGSNCEPLVEGIFGPRRELYKRTAEYAHFQQPELYSLLAGRPFDFLVRCSHELARKLTATTGIRVSPEEVLIDAPPPHREIEFQVSIYFPREKIYRSLSEVSPVVESLGKRQFDDCVKRVRIFARPSLAKQLSEPVMFETALRAAIHKSASTN